LPRPSWERMHLTFFIVLLHIAAEQNFKRERCSNLT
jgi:hypothetical protein